MPERKVKEGDEQEQEPSPLCLEEEAGEVRWEPPGGTPQADQLFVWHCTQIAEVRFIQEYQGLNTDLICRGEWQGTPSVD